MDELRTLSDDALVERFAEAVRDDSRRQAELLRLIAEIDDREIWARRAHPSMFDLCVKRFQMSESVASKRIGAARTARKFPLVFEMVARGEIHLTAIHRLKACLTEENHREVLLRARHRTTREVEVLVRELAPLPDVPSRVRALPRRAMKPALELAPSAPEARPSAPVCPDPKRAPDPQPLAPRRYKLQVTLGEEAHEQLRDLQDLLAHQIPDGDPAKIVEKALAVLRDETLKRKAALTSRPRKRKSAATESKRSRNIPAEIRRVVWKRDGGRCTFVSEDGHRCTETRGLEYGHRTPWAKGGEHTLECIALECRGHNRHAANVSYGREFMDGKVPTRIREQASGYGAHVPRLAAQRRMPSTRLNPAPPTRAVTPMASSIVL